MVHLVLNYFRTNSSLKAIYSYQDLASLSWLGDAKLEEFYRNLQEVLQGLLDPIPDGILLEILLTLIKDSSSLSRDYMEFRRLAHGHPDRTLTKLMGLSKLRLIVRVRRRIGVTNVSILIPDSTRI